MKKRYRAILVVLGIMVLATVGYHGVRQLSYASKERAGVAFHSMFPTVISTFFPNIDSPWFCSPGEFFEDGSFACVENRQSHGLFQLNYRFPLIRRIGREEFHLGDLRADISFGELRSLEVPSAIMSRGFQPIWYPKSERNNFATKGFERLEQLPETTMIEAFISFAMLKTLPETFEAFGGRLLSLDWVAVYSGQADHAQVGFLWGNGFRRELREASDFWCGREGDFFVQQEQRFICNMEFLKERADILNQFPMLRLAGVDTFIHAFDFEALLKEVSQNGVRIPGIVVSGPRNELLALEGADWISRIEVNSVAILDGWTEYDVVWVPE